MGNLKELQEQLTHEYKNVWGEIDEAETKLVMDFSIGYKTFLDVGKTERECALEIQRMAIENGYVDYKSLVEKNEPLKAGTKVYAMNKDKAICLFIIGEESIEKGMNVIGSHIDAPRIDLKPVPLYESSEMAFLKTHYYGGIKKYQWTSTPLALHGVIVTKEGKKVNVVIGEDDNDPVMFITDILPHLAKDQYAKKIGEAIGGEDLNVLIGSIPCGDKDTKDKFKFNVLRLLNEKYNVTEADLVTAELEIVPAGKARDVGLDRGLVAAYGQDDRVCAYSSLIALFEIEAPKKTAVGMFMDKEEVGSQGNTGSQSSFFNDVVAELINLQVDNYSDIYMRRAMGNTKVLSADVGAAYDPNYAGAYEKLNSGYVGKGLQIVKYTGSRGKGGCNDANAEFVAEVRNIFDENQVIWQTGELGKVDQGGGGTIAYLLANQNAEVVDCGVPVLCMHGTYEVISKADLYMAYKGYKAFYKY
ncbi:MAG: aminopeptidase [Clostridiales bacterium]|nr:aminopeptidase [Clostridiales bacterium]